MKLGFLTAIMADKSFEEVVDYASEQGFSCIEVACWPKEGAERRYAGVCHIDVETLTEADSVSIKNYCREKNVGISALAYYPNILSGDEEMDARRKAHLYRVIDAAKMLGVGLVNTFIGRDRTKTVEENLETVQKVWPEILRYAADRQIRIGIENCPMLFGKEQWPGGENLMTTPAIWKKVFQMLPFDNFGLNYDPSHFIWQQMDYVKPIYEFKDKLFHIHFKDVKLYRDKLDQVGIMAYPLEYMAPKIPGLGDIDWSKFISALSDIGYAGCGCVEIEDRAFEKNDATVKGSLKTAKNYLKNLGAGSF